MTRLDVVLLFIGALVFFGMGFGTAGLIAMQNWERLCDDAAH